MSTINIPFTAISFAFATALGFSASATDVPESVQTCAKCHNETGVSDDPDVPTLAGKSTFFLENKLAIYREEARPCADEYFKQESDVSIENHCALADKLADAEVTEAAEYFSSQTFKPTEQEVDTALAEKGASIHAANCNRCHTEGGSLALDDAGILAGQPKPYLIEQFEYYKTRERWQPEKMTPEMEKLDEQQMKALAEYYAREGLERFDE